MTLNTLDIIVFVIYIAIIIGLGFWVSREKKGHEKNAQDYFLASRMLPWWAVGASLIASNISAEQLVGMSGSGFAIGLAIASYEWMAAITLVLVAKFFLPIFLEKKIFTMPQFLEIRFDHRVRTSLAVFWLVVYIFVNLTSVLYLGALALKTIMGVPLIWGIIGLALFSSLYTIYGGLKAVAWTDVVQVIVLIGGGLVTTFLALNAVGGGEGILAGLVKLVKIVPEKFDMILAKDHPSYKELPGLSVLIGGMWIANLFYWGCNQYITQRALASRSLKEAQRGLVFAGYLKLLMPLIVVIPGIAAFALKAPLARPDEAYPWLLSRFVPMGLKGLAFAALIAAIVSSLSSMVNSTATIFSMDIYRHWFRKNATERQLVRSGRWMSAAAMLIAVLVAPMLKTLQQAFQFIQEFTGFVSPGVLAIFMLGLFWKGATTRSALWGAVLTIPLGAAFKILTPGLPFMNRMGIVFILICLVMVIVSWLEKRGAADQRAIVISSGVFRTDGFFNAFSVGIAAVLAVIYLIFW